jgi:hypothetical protein
LHRRAGKICGGMISAIYKKWIAGCNVPSRPTIAKIINAKAKTD